MVVKVCAIQYREKLHYVLVMVVMLYPVCCMETPHVGDGSNGVCSVL